MTGARFIALGIVVVAAQLVAEGVASAGNPFKGLTTTAGGYSTWDADQIDAEGLPETGAGVYVAVLDTGLVPYYHEYFPGVRIAEDLGVGFHQPTHFSPAQTPCDLEVEVGTLQETTFIGSPGSTHGTHVTSTILGYFYRSNFDANAGFPLPPIVIRGIAPDVTIIPVKVLFDYQLPARPKCTDPGPLEAEMLNFGTDLMVAAGIDYATDLAIEGYRPMVINMSLGGAASSAVIDDAIDRAIANGVIVVASAGNEGEAGMSFPGAYPPVISAGASGWTGEWLKPGEDDTAYRMWWLKYGDAPLLPGSGEVADPTSIEDLYVTDFSSRALPGQQLDVLAPGSWVRGPFPGTPGFSHLPWWSSGTGDLVGAPTNFLYAGGTSMAAPHVTSTAAMMLQKSPGLNQAQVESILKSSALAVPASGERDIFDIDHPATVTWDATCGPFACDAVGAGLLQVDAALAATPTP